MKSRFKKFKFLLFLPLLIGIVWLSFNLTVINDGFISKRSAIRIASDAVRSSLGDMLNYKSKATLRNDEWEVAFVRKKLIHGGGAYIIINAHTGEIKRSPSSIVKCTT